jgi:DegV family protein with EDD domain
MHRVGIVCDSTCDLGPEYLRDHDVRMVPLKVLIDGDSYLDWVELSTGEFYRRLATAQELPTTSQPSPADFGETFSALAGEGCEEIVSIHLSSPLSGTFQSAQIAAEDSVVPVRVVDTKLVTLATGLCVKRAVEARNAGGTADEVEAAAVDTASATELFFVLDTLEYLVKGGRAGKATGLAASLLSIKPILRFDDEGTVEPFKRAKGTAKAYATLAEHVAAASRRSRLRVAFLHAANPAGLRTLRHALDQAGADYREDMSGEVGAVIGTYAGPGAVGLAYLPD